MIADKTIKRPALRYYGGKWKLAPWIISHFPEHVNYVELCGGAASVLLRKPVSPLETYNDIDSQVVNFFRCLRDTPKELIKKISLTPWARDEYNLSLSPCDDPLESARRFFIHGFMSFNGATGDNPNTHGWRCSTDSNKRRAPSKDLINNALESISLRLLTVQIENRGYDDVIKRFDNQNALIYLDPPYVSETRTNAKDWYNFEWDTPTHIEAAELLHAAQGYVIVSGYQCPLYALLYESEGWYRVDKEATTNGGGKRIESIWLSPRTWKALHKPEKQMTFFT